MDIHQGVVERIKNFNYLKRMIIEKSGIFCLFSEKPRDFLIFSPEKS